MRQTFLGIPTDIRDSGKMDGASEFRIFVQLVMPLVKPGVAVIGLLEVMAFWNNFLWPIVVLDDPQKYPLAAALTYLNGQFSYNFGWIAAGTMHYLGAADYHRVSFHPKILYGRHRRSDKRIEKND